MAPALGRGCFVWHHELMEPSSSSQDMGLGCPGQWWCGTVVSEPCWREAVWGGCLCPGSRRMCLLCASPFLWALLAWAQRVLAQLLQWLRAGTPGDGRRGFFWGLHELRPLGVTQMRGAINYRLGTRCSGKAFNNYFILWDTCKRQKLNWQSLWSLCDRGWKEGQTDRHPFQPTSILSLPCQAVPHHECRGALLSPLPGAAKVPPVLPPADFTLHRDWTQWLTEQ